MTIHAHKEHPLRILEATVGLIALILGGLFYIIYRSEELLMFKWFDDLGLSYLISSLRMSYGQPYLCEWIKNSIPAGLWLFSYLLIIDSLWWKEKGYMYKVFLYLLPILSLGSEFLQYCRVLPGTFDMLDVCSYVFAFLLFQLIKQFKYE